MRAAPVPRSSGFALLPLHHIQLAVPRGSEDRCRAFWGEVLGLVEVEKPAALVPKGGCWFRSDALEVHLGVEEPFAPARKAHPAFRVAGVRQLAERLEAYGSPVVWDDGYPGFERFHSADPFGNRLEFLEEQR